jgi:hypothetical protein
VQQQAASFEDRKIMLTAFADHDREDGERQRANDELRLNRVAFFFRSRSLFGLLRGVRCAAPTRQ